METHIYKERLEKMLSELTEELKTIGIHNPQVASDWIAVPENLDAEEPDENVSADTIEEWNERNALVTTLEAQYNSIVKALERISLQTYDVCETCGEQIETERLGADPTASTCVKHRDGEKE
jgi:DnaK suppressor protein